MKLLGSLKVDWPQAKLDSDLYQTRFQISEWPTEIVIGADGKIVSTGSSRDLPPNGNNLATTLRTLLPNRP